MTTLADPAVSKAVAEVNVDEEWSPGLDPEELAILQEAMNDPEQIVESPPRPPERLGYLSVLFLVLNRCIGTGIFNSAPVVTYNTQSLGISIILWMCGCITALAGMYIFIELGLTIPRWSWHGEKISTPCNGGELNYLNYFLKRPKYLATCIYGISFIVIGNTAANSVAFGQDVLDAAGRPADVGSVCAIAIAANTFACTLHGMSRSWGIKLNNILGLSKLIILIFLVIVGFAAAGKTPRTAANLQPERAFERMQSTSLPYRYGEAFLFVIFPFTGFHQANYVLAEIDQPRKKYKRATSGALLIVCILFMLINSAYMTVVPREEQFAGRDIGQRFFEISMNSVAGTSPDRAHHVFSGLKAVSALGNIIVVTFTAARVKQEIAKEGVLPYSLSFAKSYDTSLGRLFGRQPSKEVAPAEKTPVAAILIHWTFTTITVIATLLSLRPPSYDSTPAYTFIVTVITYVIDLIFFICVGLGVLYLRLAPGSNWYKKSGARPWLSTTCAFVFVTALAFPLICMWIPDPAQPSITRTDGLVSWYTPQTVGLIVVAISFAYYLGFRFVRPHVGSNAGKEFHTYRKPIFEKENGYPVQTYERIRFSWEVRA